MFKFKDDFFLSEMEGERQREGGRGRKKQREEERETETEGVHLTFERWILEIPTKQV